MDQNHSTLALAVVLSTLLGSVVFLFSPIAGAAEEKPAAAAISGLPKVLIIGDSISMGYTEFVRLLLEKEADVRRIPGNGQYSDVGMEHIDEWLGDEKWDVIHFNWGIWDTHIIKGERIRNSTEVYETNLRKLVERMKATGAKLVWASTTPIAVDKSGDLGLEKKNTPVYNEVAKSLMDELKIPIDDLYSLALPRLKELQTEDGVHFTDEGSEVLAEQVAESIREALKKTATDENSNAGAK